MNNQIAKKFDTLSLLKFTLPSMIMMLFMALYQMVDAVFVSNFVSETALSALNIVYPLISFIIAVAVMLATGGSAVIAKKMGEGEHALARQLFSMVVLIGVLFGIAMTLVGIFFTRPLIHLMGSTPALDPYCYDYLYTLMLFSPFAVLQLLFQTFFITAGKPHLGLVVTVLAGIANIFFDFLFIVVIPLGVKGAAYGTAIGYCIPAIFGLIFFSLDRNGSLHFVKPTFDAPVLAHICANGSSEMVTNLSNAVTTLFFNLTMLHYLGEAGVASITIALYAQWFLTSIYFGFASGVAPVFSYNHGCENHEQLHLIFNISIRFVAISAVGVVLFALLACDMLISIFVSPSSEVFSITSSGFKLFATSFLFVGTNIFSSGMFTALSNGKVSAIISFLRTFVFLLLSMFLLPLVMGVNGIWLTVPVAELLTLGVSIFYFIRLRKVYHY